MPRTILKVSNSPSHLVHQPTEHVGNEHSDAARELLSEFCIGKLKE